MTADRITAVHYHSEWLPPTMTWLHGQIHQLDQYCDNHILCERRVQPERFPVKHLHSFDSQSTYLQLTQRAFKKVGLVSALPYYQQVCDTIRPGIIHAHFGHMAEAMLPLSRRLNIPLIVTFYGMDIHQLPASSRRIREGYARTFPHVDRVLCEGEYMASDVINLGVPAEKVYVHRLGIPLDSVSFLPAPRSSTSTRILIAASFREKKGIPLALRAIAALKDQFPLKVTLVGDAGRDESSAREKSLIMEVITSCGLSEVVHITGFRSHDELMKLAQEHDLFLSPSLHARDGDCEGGAPVGLIEMAASGLVVVSTDHCDIPGVIQDGHSGYLAQENNLDDLVSRLRSALQEDTRWDELRRNARAHIETHFDAGKQGAALFRHYTEVVHG